jgi:hypothetical protein
VREPRPAPPRARRCCGWTRHRCHPHRADPTRQRGTTPGPSRTAAVLAPRRVRGSLRC